MTTKRFTKEDAKRIGESLGIDWTRFDIEQFRMGLDVELEHGSHDLLTNVSNDDEMITGKIALAHLNEFPDYYTRLQEMESEAKKKVEVFRDFHLHFLNHKFLRILENCNHYICRRKNAILLFSLAVRFFRSSNTNQTGTTCGLPSLLTVVSFAVSTLHKKFFCFIFGHVCHCRYPKHLI